MKESASRLFTRPQSEGAELGHPPALTLSCTSQAQWLAVNPQLLSIEADASMVAIKDGVERGVTESQQTLLHALCLDEATYNVTFRPGGIQMSCKLLVESISYCFLVLSLCTGRVCSQMPTWPSLRLGSF